MKKYLAVSKFLFKAQLAFRASIAFNMLFTILKILFAVVLWGALFEQRETIGGFTYHSMLTYYVISSFFSQIDLSGELATEVSARIRGGSFSQFMVIPLRVEGHFYAQNFGAAALYLIFNLAAAIIWTLLFRIEFAITHQPGLIIGALVMEGLGLVVMAQFNYFLGLLTLRFQDIGFFLMIKSNLIAFATGVMVPLTLLPAPFTLFLRWTPFYNVTYLPSMLLLGHNSAELGQGLAVLTGWLILFAIVNHSAYESMRRRYDGVGI